MRLIVLDLDSTLVFTEDGLQHECGGRYVLEFEDGTGCEGVWRNHWKEFLETINQHFDVAVWSAGEYEYVHLISDMIKEIIPLKFVLTRDDCEELPDKNEVSIQKPFHKIFTHYPEYTYENSVIIDDNSYVAYNNPINHIGIIPFKGEPDDELLNLAKRLVDNKDIEDVFHIM